LVLGAIISKKQESKLLAIKTGLEFKAELLAGVIIQLGIFLGLLTQIDGFNQN
jgi:hypothetical protein